MICITHFAQSLNEVKLGVFGVLVLSIISHGVKGFEILLES
jgi:hypothetical protein